MIHGVQCLQQKSINFIECFMIFNVMRKENEKCVERQCECVGNGYKTNVVIHKFVFNVLRALLFAFETKFTIHI
jgi:hypothetical protein